MVLANLAHSRSTHPLLTDPRARRVINTTRRPVISLVDHHSAGVTADVLVPVEMGGARRIVVGVVTVRCWTGSDYHVVVLGAAGGPETHGDGLVSMRGRSEGWRFGVRVV